MQDLIFKVSRIVNKLPYFTITFFEKPQNIEKIPS